MAAQAQLELPPSQSEDRHKFPLWGLRLPPRYKAAMEKAARKGRRSTTEEVKIALENHFLKVMGEQMPFEFDTNEDE